MPEFDPKKPVQTRDGRPARILCTDRIGNQPIVALLINDSGSEYTVYRKLNGTREDGEESLLGNDDLINVPERKSKWQTVARKNGWLFGRFSSKEVAIKAESAALDVLGHLRFDYEDDVIVKVEFEPC